MPSSFTTNKNLELPANGEYVDTWNVPVNADMNVIDAALGGTTNLSATSGSVTLTTTQYQKLILNITGTLIGDVTYTIPASIGGQWVVRNATTGAFTVTIASGGAGSSVVTSQSTIQTVYSDGTNIRSIGTTSAEVDALFASKNVNAGTGLTGGGSLSGSVTLTADQASAANWRQNVANKLLNPNAVWSAMSEVTLTDAANVAWDMSLGFDFILTPTANRVMDNPTNTKVGQKGRLIIQQDGTGGRTLTWGSNFKFANGTAPTLSSSANAVDILYYDVRSSSYIIISLAGRAFA